MLSDSLREMRREIQQILRDAPDGAERVEVPALWLLSYVLALGVYEDEAAKFERAYCERLATDQTPTSNTVVLFRDYQKSRPQLHVVQVDGSGSDIA